MKICVYGLGRFGRCVVKRLNDSAASERASDFRSLCTYFTSV